MLANRLKKKFCAKVIADWKVQHYDECRREIEALANQEFERIAREHAAQLDSQRILTEKADTGQSRRPRRPAGEYP